MATITVLPLFSPRIIVVDAPDTEITVQELVNKVRAWEDTVYADSFPFLIDAAGKEDLGGGVSVGITATLQNAQVMFEARTTPLDNGTTTATDATGRTMTDSTAQFVTDDVIYRGCTVFNSTTGEMESVLDFDETTITSLPLSGAGGSGWTSGDAYVIYPNVQCDISGGNLVAVDDVGASISAVTPSPNTQVVRTASSSATSSDIDAIQYSSYQNAVWIDNTTSNSGTAYPVGNREFPVNNLTDAVSIANAKGFSTLQILESMTLNAGTDIEGFEIIGKSHVNTVVTMDASALSQDVTIRNCQIQGTLDGGTHIVDCVVGDITYVNGHIHNSGLTGTITLGGSLDAILINCVQVGTSNPVIDMGGSGQNLSVTEYSGNLSIKNLTSPLYTAGIGLSAGRVILESTVTAGVFIVSGIGLLQDDSTSTTALSDDGLISRETITKTTWNRVYIDVAGGSSGTTFPLGTQGNPVDNIADAKTIADNNGFHEFYLRGEITLTGDYSEYDFYGISYEESKIICSSATLNHSVFFRCRLTGSCASGEFEANDCVFTAGFTGMYGVFDNCQFVGAFTVQAGNYCKTDRCTAGDSCSFDLNGTGTFQAANFSGIMSIGNCSNAASTIGITGYYVLTLDADITAGQILLGGIGTLTNNTTSTTLFINKTIPSTVWDEPLTAHTTSGTTGEYITKIKKWVGWLRQLL